MCCYGCLRAHPNLPRHNAPHGAAAKDSYIIFPSCGGRTHCFGSNVKICSWEARTLLEPGKQFLHIERRNLEVMYCKAVFHVFM